MAKKQSSQTLYKDLALLIARVVAGGLMLTHGFPKMKKLFAGGEISFADPIGVGEMPSLILTVLAEVLCAVLVILGLWTRWAAIPLIITMLVAAFIVHLSDPIGDKEMSLLYAALYIVIAAFGAGKYSIDGMRK